MEDVVVLMECFKKNLDKGAKEPMKRAIEEYSDKRPASGHAIADMALFNYWVMRKGMALRSYMKFLKKNTVRFN